MTKVKERVLTLAADLIAINFSFLVALAEI